MAKLTCPRPLLALLPALTLVWCAPGFVSRSAAQACSAEQIAQAVDEAGAALRAIMAANQPRLDQRVKALQAKYRWPDSEAEDKALELLADQRTTTFDRTANDLLARLDTLGNLPQNAVPECSRLQELDATAIELQAVVKAKAAHLLARADAILADKPANNAAAPQPSQRPAAPATTAPATTAPAPSISKSAPTTPSQAAPLPPAPWSTTTTTVDARAAQSSATRATTPPASPSIIRDDDGFSIDEIVRASSGLFGKVSAGLGSVVEHAFSSIGRPTGYILGEETGGAFLAGLRYGKGTLYLRDGRSMPIFWHGPSLGLDVGAQGAKIMFLAYRLREPDQLFPTFTSLEGSAFIAGGIGLTLMTNGGAQLAPIRSGIGLRLGASVGYVRFTTRPTWNPF